MPALSRYGAAGAQSKKFSRRLAKASEYGSLAQTAKETGARKQQAISDTLESIQKIAGAVGEVRKEVKFGEEVQDIARGGYGIETTTEKGFLGIPKTTYTEADTGKALSAMEVYAYGKYGEGTPKYERLFGEEAQRERGMKEIAGIQETDITAAAASYEGRKEQYDLMEKQNKELLERQSKIVVSEEAVSESDPDVLKYGAMQEAKESPSLAPKRIEPSIGPGRKEPEKTGKFEAPPDEAMLQMKAPDRDLFAGGTSKEILAATLLGEAGTQGREGMGAVMSTIRSRQSTLASRGEKYSLAEIALAPSQYSFWNEANVQMSSDVLGRIEQMKGENPRGWEAAMEMTENFQSDLPQAEFYLNPDIAEESEYNRFSGMEGQEYSIGEHIFKSAPKQVLSPAKLWESLWEKRGQTGKKYQGIKWLME